METSPHGISTGTKRRTVLKAAAWSAPIVAVAAATPAAAASEITNVDLFLEPPQMGESYWFYSPDHLTSYAWGGFLGFHVSNSGTEDAPAGTIVQLSYDPRVFEYSNSPTIFIGDVEHELAYTVTQLSATTATLTMTIDIPIPAQSTWESQNSVLVRMNPTYVLRYPNDTVDNPGTYSEMIVSGQDSNTANNSRGPFSPTVHNTGPYEFTLDVASTSATITRCDMTLPQTVSVTNSGYGTPEGNDPILQLDVDNTAVTNVAVTSVEIDGVAVAEADYSVEGPTDESSSWWVRVSKPLPVGATLVVEFDYTIDADAGVDPINLGYAHVQARIANDFANYSSDFWAYRGDFPSVKYANTGCQL